MSYYEDERRRQHRPTKDRHRRDSYDDESAYTSRETPRGSGALVKRRDSYDSVDEEITRDFSPGRGGYYKETTIRKSGTRPARTRSFEDDRYDRDDRSYGGGRRSSKYYDDRYDRRSRRYSSDYSSRSRSRTPPRHKDKERRKSKSEDALQALGLGGLAATLLGKKEQDRSRSRSRDRDHGRSRGRAHSEDRHDSRRRSKSRGGPTKEQLTQAIKAAVLAGAGEAFRARKEPGGWTGDKGKRVLTAAAAAGGLDGLISHGKGEDDHKTRNTIGSAIAGIATSRIVNGPRSKSRGGRDGSPDSRGGRSQSRGFGDLVAGGITAVGAKKAYDSVRGRSSSRGRGRSRSVSSDGSRSPPRASRRRSLSRGVAKGLAAVGLTGAADRVDPDRRHSDRRDDYDSRSDGRGYDGDYYRDDVGAPRSGFPSDAQLAMGAPRSLSRSHSDWEGANREGTPSYSLDYGARHNGDPETDSDSDLGSSSGEEKERKKGKRKTLLTTGLAAVATIHAGHSVYQSYEKRHARQKAVKEGTITAEQAKANRNRDRLQDAASIGLAALGIKGAYSEFKEMKEAREEFAEKKETIERHRAKRAARREKFRQLGYPQDGDEHAISMPDLHAPQPMHAVPYGPNNRYRVDPRQDYGPPPLPVYDGYGPYNTGTMQPPGPQYFDDNPYGSQAPPQPPPAGSMPVPPLSRSGSTRQLMTPPSSSPSSSPRPRSPGPRGRDPGPPMDPRQQDYQPANPARTDQLPINPQPGMNSERARSRNPSQQPPTSPR